MDLTSLPSAWWGTTLPGYRGGESVATYNRYEMDTLPPVPSQLGDDYEWLRALPAADDGVGVASRATWDQIVAAGFTPPREFERFVTDASLTRHVGSCTGCWIDLAGFDLGGGECLVLFLRDQQDVVLWFLHVRSDGGHSVIASTEDAVGAWLDADEPRVSGLVPEFADAAICASGFVEFLYRFAIENSAWNVLAGVTHRRLCAPEREYLGHYRNAERRRPRLWLRKRPSNPPA